MASTRLLRLDGLRGVAAFAVAFFYHSQFVFAPGQFARPTWGLAAHVAASLVALVHGWGWTLVDLFFVLSGYVMAEAYLADGRLWREGGIAHYASARLARLYPLHIATLLACLIISFGHTTHNTALAFAAHLVMAQAFVAPAGDTFDGPAWSISIEAVCYVLFALGARFGPRGMERVAWLAVGWALFRIAMFDVPGGPYAEEFLPRGLMGFFIGQMLWRERARLGQVPAWALWASVGVGCALARLPITPLLGLGLLVWPAVVMLALRARVLESRAMVWLGARSYGIYLIHMPLYYFIGNQFGHPLLGLAGCLGLHGALMLVVMGLAELSYRCIEMPGRALLAKSLRALFVMAGGTTPATA